jgi:hypothetical protein
VSRILRLGQHASRLPRVIDHLAIEDHNLMAITASDVVDVDDCLLLGSCLRATREGRSPLRSRRRISLTTRRSNRVGFHGFRHGAVSALIRAGVDPVRVAKYVGDRVETILSTYAHEWKAQGDDNLGDVLGTAMATGGN